MKTSLVLIGVIALASAPFVSFADEKNDVHAGFFFGNRMEMKDNASHDMGRGEPHKDFKAIVKAGIGTLEGAKERALAEIERRVDILNQFIDRIAGAKKISADDKATLTANLNARLAELADLKVEVQNSTSTTTIKAAIKSLADLHAAFKMNFVKVALESASERILSVVSQMEKLSAKLSTRIDAAATAGTDVTDLRAKLTSFNASVASAKVSGQAALDASKALNTDAQATSTAVASIRAKINDAKESLKDARDAAGEITVGLGIDVRAGKDKH